MPPSELMTGLRRFAKTTAFRLSLIHSAIFAVAVGLAGVYFYWQTHVLLVRQLDQTIRAELLGLAEQYRTGGMARLSAIIAERSRTPGNSLYYVADASGRRIAGNLRTISKGLAQSRGRVEFSYVRSLGDSTERRAAYASVIRLADGFILIVGRDIEDRLLFERRIRNALVGGLLFVLIGGLIGALIISRNLLRRIDAITETTQRIMRGNLSERLPMAGSDDELDRLSQSLNVMLERIEHLMAGMQEVSHNIAHDLRTPLNRLRNRVEAALHAGKGEAVARDALEKTIEEADGLIKTFNALLSIARLEAGSVENEMSAVDLQEIIRDVAELYEPVAEEQGVRLEIADSAGSCLVRGNRQLLGQAVANLIDNALKYAVPQAGPVGVSSSGHLGHGPHFDHGSKAANSGSAGSPPPSPMVSPAVIEVAWRRVGEIVEIVVADHGPGIAPHERQRALQRFTRLDASRSRPGSGLGLSLVSAVANCHGGTLRLEDNAPGLRAVLTIRGEQM